MDKKNLKILKLIISIVIIGLFVWFLVISPMITFYNNEKALKSAAERYFELNSEKLPTGERVKTLSLNELYKDAYLKEDLRAPYSSKVCSIENSWVKVKKVNGKYNYYTYLDCGVLKSSVDHKGPEIKLNGENDVTTNIGEKYNDPGVSSVVDDNDGKLKVEDVTVKSNVNTDKIGTYEIEYIAYDSMRNKTSVTRTVKVVKRIKNVVQGDLDKATNYVGNPTNNYVRLSNMMFRIYGINQDDNIILVAVEDVSNVNHTKIDKWLDYYYDHLNKKTKKMIVKSKFCNEVLSEDKLNTTECISYTDKKNIYVPSVVEVNRAGDFMKPSTMSWVSNKKNKNEAYLTRNIFFGDEYGKSFLPYNVKENYGIRPMFVIKGDSLITNGDGTLENPYQFGDTKPAKGGDLLNTRYTGEYLINTNTVWRIIDTLDDGTTKVIAEETLNDENGEPLKFSSMDGKNNLSYNPNNKNNVAYSINNKVSKYVDTSIFVKHKISVPIYSKGIIYGQEESKKTYSVKLSAPDMYEIFSAQPNINGHVSHSYWLINSPKGGRAQAVIQDIGVPLNAEVGIYDSYGVRLTAFVKSDMVISSGDGTLNNPYKLK